MTEHVDALIEALRIELQHYGELLALLDASTDSTPRGCGIRTFVAAALDALLRQGAALTDARGHRLQIQSRLAWANERPREESLRNLLSALPSDYQPLVRALADEIEDLMARVHECARINHQHLHHAADQLEGLIESVAASVGEVRPVTSSINA